MSILKINRKTSVNQMEIMFLESISNYTCVHTQNRQLVSAVTMKKLLLKIEQVNFLKINRGLSVNTTFILKIDIDSDYPHIVMANKKKLPISRRRVQFVSETLLHYLTSKP